MTAASEFEPCIAHQIKRVSDFVYTYVLECGDGKLYVGSTIDLKRRIGEHLCRRRNTGCQQNL